MAEGRLRGPIRVVLGTTRKLSAMAVPEPIEYPAEPLEDPRARRSRLGLAGLLLFSSLVHFVAPRLYVKLIPARLGRPRFWVFASGVAEATSGAMLLAPSPRIRRAGGWSAAATMVAVFPGNIQMAVDAGAPKSIRAVGAWARLPLQVPLVAWGVRIARGR
jgi:uncharacterized membrane protein